MSEQFVSHIRRDAEGQLQERPLVEHLRAVAAMAADFASGFGARDWGEAAGRWHDLGKMQSAWQTYLRSHYRDDVHEAEPASRVPHALAGAQYAERELGLLGRLLAYVIAGHHAGLPDFHSSDAGAHGTLRIRFEQAQRIPARDELALALENCAHLPADILARPDLKPDAARMASGKGCELELSLWLRMLFSCLVDADFLDAEAFLDPQRHVLRPRLPEAAELLPAFDVWMAAKTAGAKPTPVNRVRAEVLMACREAGRAKRFESGIYSLTVPTGGGKTLASLAFALEHAKAHGKRRVIYAIPFTSIIEQTAQVFRDVLASLPDGTVIEHHSNLDPDKQPGGSHLAAENWDGPLVVTTNVQLFESLFAARTSRCRKLHNLVDSVIVLDEAQQLPPAFLAPIAQTLRLLARHYGVTVLLCTATQPKLDTQHDAFGRVVFPGIDATCEIIPDPTDLYARLKRVYVTLPARDAPRPSWEALADELRTHDCVLTIVNTRQDAHDLYTAIGPDAGAVHLSARMCAEHRADVIASIRQHLQAKREGKDSLPLRVVSTTLVEAGVDLDFPVVYRALAGLDAIAQAAGRCNREGRLPALGQVVVFRPETERGRGELREARDIARELIESGRVRDALAPETFADYFHLLYSRAARNPGGLDAKEIIRLLTPDPRDCAMAFRTAADRFHLIDEKDQTTVIVRYARDDAMRDQLEAWLGALAKDPSQRWVYRKLQRFGVGIPKYEFEQLLRDGRISPIAGLFVAVDGTYDARTGLIGVQQALAPDRLVW